MSDQPVISLSRVCVEFDGEHVLEDIDIDIAAGEFVALLGPNGSGKTTLVRSVVGLQPIDHGSVHLFGTPLPSFRAWDRVSFVPQRLPGATSIPVSVEETVLAGLVAPGNRWMLRRRALKAAAEDALRSVGLWDRRRQRLDALSGGQQRRVLVARALATDADLILMDEPTAGVDAQNVAIIVGLLRSLHERGKTVVIVTHELDDIEPLVTRAVVLGGTGETSVRYDGPPPIPHALHDHVHHHDDEIDEPTPFEPALFEASVPEAVSTHPHRAVHHAHDPGHGGNDSEQEH